MDVDLSALNHTNKSNIAGPPRPVTPAKRESNKSARQTPDRDEASPNCVEVAGESQHTPQEPQSTPSRSGEEDDNGVLPLPSRVQILDLNTTNPIVSYMDQVYSCTWADMVGTNMFFTHPGASDVTETLQSTDDYDLIGTSRIKLVGDRANMAKKNQPKKRARVDDDDADEHSAGAEDAPLGRSLGGLRRSNPTINAQIKKQASFLNKLMEIKRQRGETDLVRTLVDEKIASADTARLHAARHDEIDELNRKVLKGDADALARLQEIYAQPDDKDTEPDEITRSPEE